MGGSGASDIIVGSEQKQPMDCNVCSCCVNTGHAVCEERGRETVGIKIVLTEEECVRCDSPDD